LKGRTVAAGIYLLVGALIVGGCARGGETQPGTQAVMDIWVQFAGPIDDSAYYYIAFNKNPNYANLYPIPIVTGPFWGNGWGTGSMSHFLEYHLGAYNFFQARLQPVLRIAGGGITAVSGTVSSFDAGRYTLRVGAISPGAASVSGTGMISAVTNLSGQNAGVLSLQTDAGGKVVAGSVSFTPAADGGRAPNGAEQAALNRLNAGGVSLQADSLADFGLSLTLTAPAAGTQTLTIAPATATVQVNFVPASSGAAVNTTGTLRANSSTPTDTPPIPGAVITTADLVTGGEARVDAEFSQAPTLIGPPYAYTLPAGGNSLRATLDLADFGPGLRNLAFNIIATTDLNFDPTVTDPALHCYDALGPLGNDAVSFSATEFRTLTNADSFIPEGPNDPTLQGNVTPDQRRAVDIVNWSITLRRL
jgi:hypothetical protein